MWQTKHFATMEDMITYVSFLGIVRRVCHADFLISSLPLDEAMGICLVQLYSFLWEGFNKRGFLDIVLVPSIASMLDLGIDRFRRTQDRRRFIPISFFFR